MTQKKLNNNESVPNDQRDMSFMDHLEELRWNLLRAVVVIVLFSIVAFFFKDFIFDQVILAPKEPYFPTNKFLCELADRFDKEALCINQNPVQIINIKITGQFVIHITISFIAGFLISFPYTIYELWKFVSPALYTNEKKYSRRSLFAINILFFLGVMLGYFIIVPISVNFLGTYNVSDMVTNTIDLRSYISTISSISLAAGLIFELPVLTYFLSKIGLLTPHIMRRYRRHAIVAILILASVITPPDVMSQLLIGFPLFLLYELSIRVSSRVLKKAS